MSHAAPQASPKANINDLCQQILNIKIHTNQNYISIFQDLLVY